MTSFRTKFAKAAAIVADIAASNNWGSLPGLNRWLEVTPDPVNTVVATKATVVATKATVATKASCTKATVVEATSKSYSSCYKSYSSCYKSSSCY